MTFRRLIDEHPLGFCMAVAILLRMVAVFLSPGYMANDDHFETIRIAYEGIQNGLLNDNGLMRWGTVFSDQIARSPLYVLTLYGQMRFLKMLGIDNLDTMMYFIRFVHALLSLLTVWYGYKYVSAATGSRRYSLLAGLMLAGHFLLPYLSVRNLIEQVSADLIVPALFLIYKSVKYDRPRAMIFAGLLCGLSWMIRFNLAIIAVIIPPILWYQTRNIRPVLYYTAGFLTIIFFSGTLDLIYLGGFWRSSLNIIGSVIYPGGPPPNPQPVWTYLILILAALIPPFSFYFIFSIFDRVIIREHPVIFSSTVFFFLVHSLIRHKEERFIIPIFPLLIILGIIGLHHAIAERKSYGRQRLFRWSAILAAGVNIVLLALFTANYGHKGMVEPFVFLSRQSDLREVLIDQTDRRALLPYSYAGLGAPEPVKIDVYDVLGPSHRYHDKFDSINYFVIFADTGLAAHVDSLTPLFGRLHQVFHSRPTILDRILHSLNPRHNFANESWVFKKDE